MVEETRQSVAKMLQGIDRYNPDNIPILERYVEIQSQENAYHLEANLAVLKLYQFDQQYNIEIIAQILLKALTNFPHTDFALCKCLLNEKLCSETPINQIVYLADLLESCEFQQFWKSAYSVADLYTKINGFLDSIRKFVCHVVGITFQTISRNHLKELLGGIEEHSLKQWIKKYGWKEERDTIFIAHQEDNIKTKNISEEIPFDAISRVLALY